MRVTVGRRWPKSAPRGDSQAICGYCGVQWRRSQLWRDQDGLLVCPDEGPGRSEGELAEANAGRAAQASSNRVSPASYQVDTDGGSEDPPQRTTLEDIEL
jgi:hypothetical protein